MLFRFFKDNVSLEFFVELFQFHSLRCISFIFCRPIALRTLCALQLDVLTGAFCHSSLHILQKLPRF